MQPHVPRRAALGGSQSDSRNVGGKHLPRVHHELTRSCWPVGTELATLDHSNHHLGRPRRCGRGAPRVNLGEQVTTDAEADDPVNRHIHEVCDPLSQGSDGDRLNLVLGCLEQHADLFVHRTILPRDCPCWAPKTAIWATSPLQSRRRLCARPTATDCDLV